MNNIRKNLVIVGSGGFAKEVSFLIEQINHSGNVWNLLGYIDANIGEKIGKYSIIANDQWLLNYKEELFVVIGIGNPEKIHSLSQKFQTNPNLTFPNIIHPNTIIDYESVTMGIGNIICPNNILTSDIILGSFNILNLSCTVGHDSKIGSFNVINPNVNISGGVYIEDKCFIGTSATILQNIKISKNIVIGAAALITKNLTEMGIYIGIPAKIKNKKRI
jgi:sugar O-acyltransferase (sialic acid O-acetyltransferase NeuD family)